MAKKILLLKRSDVKNSIPHLTDLELGELAINTADGKIYTRTTGDLIKDIEAGGNYSTINGISIKGEGDIELVKPSDLLNKSPVTHTHTAENIVESAQSQLLTSTDLSTLTDTTTKATTIANRLVAISNITPDGKVKLTENGEADFMSAFIDPLTLQYEDGSLHVTGISGVLATTDELSSLSGLKGDIQSQVAKVLTAVNTIITVESFAELSAKVLSNNDLAVVTTDETHDNNTTMYLYNGTEWLFIGDYTGTEIRDFTINPIDLATETTGQLAISQLPNQIAFDTPLNSPIASGANVENGINDFISKLTDLKRQFTFALGTNTAVNNITTLVNNASALKVNIENAITSAGVTISDNSLSGLSEEVINIPIIAVSGKINSIPAKNYPINSVITLKFSADINVKTICATPVLVTPGQTGYTLFSKTFTNNAGYTAEGMFDFTPAGAAGTPTAVKQFSVSSGTAISTVVEDLPKSITL